jgi:hypothetical protein
MFVVGITAGVAIAYGNRYYILLMCIGVPALDSRFIDPGLIPTARELSTTHGRADSRPAVLHTDPTPWDRPRTTQRPEDMDAPRVCRAGTGRTRAALSEADSMPSRGPVLAHNLVR